MPDQCRARRIVLLYCFQVPTYVEPSVALRHAGIQTRVAAEVTRLQPEFTRAPSHRVSMSQPFKQPRFPLNAFP